MDSWETAFGHEEDVDEAAEGDDVMQKGAGGASHQVLQDTSYGPFSLGMADRFHGFRPFPCLPSSVSQLDDCAPPIAFSVFRNRVGLSS
jgi:hypothetical protein